MDLLGDFLVGVTPEFGLFPPGEAEPAGGARERGEGSSRQCSLSKWRDLRGR